MKPFPFTIANAALAGALTIPCGSRAADGPAPAKPNILIILTDDK